MQGRTPESCSELEAQRDTLTELLRKRGAKEWRSLQLDDWKPVSDPPTEDKFYLVFVSGEVRECWWAGSQGTEHGDWLRGHSTLSPTHWRPMPDPPLSEHQ